MDKQALLEAVWPHVIVEENNLNQAISTLRRVFGETRDEHRFIVTEPGRGYRFVASVEAVPAVTTEPSPAQAEAAILPRADGAPAPTSRHPPASAPRDRQSKRPRLILASAAIAAACAVAAIGVYWLAGERTESADIAARAPLPNSVAVLPFDNLSPTDDAYFAAGMQEEIVSQLTKISGLRVFLVPPGAGAQRSIQDIGRDLNVATVLGGSVRYSEGRVRVTPRLTQATTSENLWSDSYERERSDIFAIQSDIALDVAHALNLELSAVERERIERVPTTNPQARDLYIMATARNPTSREQVLLAIDEIEQALKLDPEFKEAWVLDSNIRSGYAALADPERGEEHRLRGEHAARQALDLDPELGEGYAALGLSLAGKRDWTGAEKAFRRAKSLNVPLAGLGSYAFLQLAAGKFGGVARDIFEESQAAEPTNGLFYRFLAFVHEGVGEWARAEEFYDSALRLFGGDNPEVHRMFNQRMHWLVGRKELAEARTIPIADPLNEKMLALDKPEQALAELRSAYAASVAGNPNLRRDIGLWAGHFGDPALAFEALRAAIDEQGSAMTYVWLPQLAPMRRLPEFKTYMRDIGMVAYWQEYGWPTFCRQGDGDDFDCH